MTEESRPTPQRSGQPPRSDNKDSIQTPAGSNSNGPTEFGDLVPGSQFISRVFLILFVTILAWIAYQVLPALILFFAAIVLAIVFHGCARLLDRFLPGGRGLALTVTILLFVGLFSASVVLLAPNVGKQIQEVVRAASDAYERFAATPFGEAVLSSGSEPDGAGGDELAIPLDASLLGKAAGWATNAVRSVTSLTLVFVVAIFMAASPRSLRRGITSIVPLSLRPRIGEVVDETARALWRWTIGQGFSMLVIGLLSFLGYLAIGLNFALALGLIAGLFQFIPYLGPALSAIPALLVAFSMSPQMALWAAVVYAIIQTIEGNFITPIIMKRKAYLPPVLTIMATVIFGLLFGLAGAALATPLIVVFLTIYNEVYQKDVLGAGSTAATSSDS